MVPSKSDPKATCSAPIRFTPKIMASATDFGVLSQIAASQKVKFLPAKALKEVFNK